MKSKRVIVKLTTLKGVMYEVGNSPAADDFEVKSIEFRRDGLRSVNLGAIEPDHYLITMEHPMDDKNKVFKVIPYKQIEDLMYVVVEIENSNKDESGEAVSNMKRE